ncbi:MAG TPA: bifunctional phosphoribosylaminoimidazolecarboxamide formyltransferase/IMP cyclohydrolase, partial [Gammaproteobacteria bacterium]|nr:bifunctional phosphoribosylaminoimidazolecarboxamide formyltransferase/IMP cyclohydrolase [Gammaproteobacteria bacterium]
MNDTLMRPLRALISVSDKTGVVDFARRLQSRGLEIISTGGTAKLLRDEDIVIIELSDYTGHAEIMDGRVKTLHPRIHGGILGRRGIDDAVMAKTGIKPIDLVVVNLYPFEQTVAKPDHTLEEAIENIDIGGPAMLRAAAKNFARVAVVTDPRQYVTVLTELEREGGVSFALRFRLAVEAFNHVSNYDGAISNYLSALTPDGKRRAFPAQANGRFVKVMDLRYGENPHQHAALYRDLNPVSGAFATFRQLQGKELSYNNIA